MEELLHVLLIYSGNDAAMAIARQVGGTVDQFVEMMNQEAAALGATGTHFVNPSGLHDENHYTTVYDIYLMLNEALSYPKFAEVMQLSSYNLTFTRNGEEQTIHMDSTDQYMTHQGFRAEECYGSGRENGYHRRCRLLSGPGEPERLWRTVHFHRSSRAHEDCAL